MKSFFTLLLIIFSAQSFSAQTLYNKKISKVHVNTDYGYYFKIEGTMEDPDNCGGSSGVSWYKLKSDTPYVKEFFSLLMTAYLADKQVTFRLDGCSPGTNPYPIVIHGNMHD